MVVEDGTEFKAHRKVLSEASSFFEKLLNTDMMESKKGVVRLEMLTKAALGAVLEFIYTGDVQILTEDDARDLIEMADYLFILPLKTLAGRVLAQTLNTSNCISAYYFAERYQCEELVSDAKKFIYANFASHVAKADEFLNMSSVEVNQWISNFESPIWERDFILLRYDSFFDRCTDVPYEGKRDLQQIFVSDNNEDGIYALESENEISCPDCASLHSCNGPEEESKIFTCGNQHLSYITRYKPESNSWEDISSFDLGLKMGICIVAKDNFIYFIGGAIHGTNKVLNDVDRYDLSKRKWDKLAGLQIARRNASGTAAHGKIFITGGLSEAGTYADSVKTCEVYNETKNEWHIIAKSSIVCRSIRASILCVDDKVYVVDDSCCNSDGKGGEIECYDPCKDKWDVITEIPSASPDLRYRGSFSGLHVGSCSMRVFKGRNLQQLQQPRPQGHVRFQDGGRRNPYTYLNRV
ncbi:hypothetical protein ACROYT_G027626 [Oculina patagonica]